MTTAGLLSALAAGAGTLAIGVYIVAQRLRRTEAEASFPEAETLPAEGGSAPAPSIMRVEVPNESTLDALLARGALGRRLEAVLDAAHLGWTPGTMLGYVFLGVAGGLLTAVTAGPWLGLAVAIVGGTLPIVHATRARSARQRAIEAQLPTAIDMLVNALRSGYSLLAAMRFISEELPEPLGPDFARYFDEQQLGVDQREALLNLQDRLGTLDARMFVLAVLIQRETGGNLSEVLGNVSRVIRYRLEFRQQVGVLTAEANMSSLILAALPVFMYGVMLLINREYVAPLTSTPAGHVLLGYGVVSLLIGFLLLRRIARIEV